MTDKELEDSIIEELVKELNSRGPYCRLINGCRIDNECYNDFSPRIIIWMTYNLNYKKFCPSYLYNESGFFHKVLKRSLELGWSEYFQYLFPESIPQPILCPLIERESKMSSKFFEKKAYVNGIDISTMDAKKVMETIYIKEAEIKQLQLTIAQPIIITEAIKTAKAELQAFVDYLQEEHGTGS